MLSFIPFITQFVVWTNQHHHLVWKDFELVRFGNLTAIEPVFGAWFWINTAYLYSLIVFGLAVLINNTFHASALSRRQH